MGWVADLMPGRMPLALAWVVAAFLVPWLLFGLAHAAAGTAIDQPLFFGLLIGSVAASMLIAHLKRRRWWLWGVMAAGAGGLMLVMFVLGPVIQPVTVALAVALARPPVIVPPVTEPAAEEESEEAEDDATESEERAEDAGPDEDDRDTAELEEDEAEEEGYRPIMHPPGPKPFRPHRRRRR